MSENIKIGKIIASACCNGITIVINGTDISDIEPPKTLSVLRSLNNSFNIPSQENVKDNTILH